MISTFALHPAAAKYIIAQGVVKHPAVQNAFTKGRILLSSGTTNIAVAEHLLNIKIDNPDMYVAGAITQQVACSTNKEQRQAPWCIERGKVVDVNWLEFLDDMGADDVFIKGANAFDPEGNVGILMADPKGGTIGKAIGTLKAKGITTITPVGLEKLIPSCRQAEKVMGIYKTSLSLGLKTGYMVLSDTIIITEIESCKLLFDIDTTPVAAGGVGGMEGAVFLAAECSSEEQAINLLKFVKIANRLPAMTINKKKCADCTNPCYFIGKSGCGEKH